MGRWEKCPQLTIRRKYRDEQSLSSLRASEEINSMSHHGGTQRPFLTNSADTTMTLAPSRHSPSTLISLAMAAKRTRLPCLARGERGAAGQGWAGGEPQAPSPLCGAGVPGTATAAPAQQRCPLAFSPPPSSHAPGQLS